MKKFIIFLLICAILFAGGFFFLKSYVDKNLASVDATLTDVITVEIPSGSSTDKIANILYDNGLIKDKNVFKYYAKKEGFDVKLKAGKFELSKSMDVATLLNALVNNSKSDNTINLRLIEGLTSQMAAKTISEQLGLDYDKLLKLMENADYFRNDYKFLQDEDDIEILQGYLLPETYNMYKGLSEEEVIRFLLDQFEKYYEKTILPTIQKNDIDLDDLITLASIVEREAMLKEERSTIAGVFYNRLEIDMPLQSCATVNYLLDEWKDRLTTEDISIESPYNTYINKGLPPTPINSPGKASIEACLNPEKTDYLYFLAKGDGSHHFSKTYKEHLAAKAKYLD